MALTQKDLEYLGQFTSITPQDKAGVLSPEADLAETRALRASRREKTQSKGYIADTIQQTKDIGSDIKESLTKRGQNISETQSAFEKGDQGLLRSAFQKFGQVAGGVSDVIGSTVMGGIKAITPEFIQKPAGELVQAGAEKVMETDTAQKLFNAYQNLDEDTKRDIGATLGIGSLATDIVGGALVKKPVTSAVKKSFETAVDVAKATKNVVEPAIDIAKGLGTKVADVTRSVAQTPSRIATNVAEEQAKSQAIKSLKTPNLQKAAREGVEIPDIKTISEVPKFEKPAIKKLFETVKKFEEGTTKTNPIELVGKPIVTRIKKLNTQVQSIGKKLDSTVKNLKFQSVKKIEELGTKIDSTLSEQGITFTKGKLNLKGSQLEGLGGNETVIQNVYKRFVNAKDAQDLHRLKKYIDDNVEFGKTSQGLTGNAESLLKGWRKSIDDTLDSQFPTYKKLNDEYRARISPLSDLKKLMKDLGADEDLLNMKAGLLARRLTSNAQSNPQIRQILRNLDKATKVTGKTTLSVERLQDVYNILEKYYDIAAKTGFQGQISSSLGKITDIPGALLGKAQEFAGKTNATRKKALEDALKELLN